MPDPTSGPEPTGERIHSRIGQPGSMLLNEWGATVARAFGPHVYQVGSSLLSRGWRDVDVRVMLPVDEFRALFGRPYPHGRIRPPYHADPLWSLVCSAIALHGARATGLPIDFQIQITEEANAEFDGPRSAIGFFHSRDDDRE